MNNKVRKGFLNNSVEKKNTSKTGNDMSNAIKRTEKRFCGDICIAIDAVTFDEVRCLRKDAYKDIYPEMDLDNDMLDNHAITLYTRNERGEMNSTARLTLDGPGGLPEDQFLSSYRKEKKRLIEWGRFIIVDGNISLLKKYYESVFSIATNLNCDSIVMAMKPKDIPFHERLTGVNIVKKDMKITYGGPYSLACVVWDITDTKDAFFNWIGAEK